MINPDAEGFIIAAQIALRHAEVVYLHNAEGDVCAVLLTPDAWKHPAKTKLRRPIEHHAHLEPGEDVPWLILPESL